jgi:hypothetical protein
MPDQQRPGFSHGGKQGDHVVGTLEDRIILDRCGFRAFAKAANVGRDHPEARRCKRRDLMAPFKPGVGKAMQQDDEWPAAFLDIMDGDAVGLDHVMRERGGVVHSVHDVRPA